MSLPARPTLRAAWISGYHLHRATPATVRAAFMVAVLVLVSMPATAWAAQRPRGTNVVGDPQSAAVGAGSDTVSRATRLEMFHRYLRFGSYLSGGRVEPDWLADGDRFKFTVAGDPDGRTWLVDPAANTGEEWEDGSAPGQESAPAEPGPQPRVLPESVTGAFPVREALSPDRRWLAGLRSGNLVLRRAGTDSIVELTTDGSADRPWGDAYFAWTVRWSPGSDRLLATRYSEPQADATNGPSIRSHNLAIVDVPTGSFRYMRIEAWPGQEIVRARWAPDGSTVLVQRLAARGQVMEVLAVDPADGNTRVLVSETAPEGGYLYPPNEPLFWVFLEDGRRFIVRLERDGWQHLFLYDTQEGPIRQLTSGPFPVRDIEYVDEKGGWVYFLAHTDPDRPYDHHLARVSLDGEDMTVLTESPGQHTVQFSPSGRFFIDTYATSSQPYRSELRTADGRLIRTLATATDNLVREELGWTPPEEFTALAADGRTRLHGLLFKPWDFDPAARYPVIDFFHSMLGVGANVFRDDGPGQATHVSQALAQLGFIVVTFDTRGTFWRGVEFRNSTFEKGARLEIDDHVSVLQGLASTRPWMDIERSGAFGFSTFGFFSARAMLLAPDVYRAGVAAAAPDFGASINDRMWFYVSFTPGEEFKTNSMLADRLQGRLLFISGTEDVQGPLEGTMSLIEGLVRAGRQYDLRLIPGATHAMFWPGQPYSDYFWDTVADHFLDNLTRDGPRPFRN